MEFFKNLSLTWKLILGTIFLFLIFFLASWFTGLYESFDNWLFDRNMAKIEEQNKVLESEISELRKQNEELKKERVGLDAELKIYKDATLKSKEERQKEEQKLQDALKEMDKIEEETAKPISDFDKCQRINTKIKTPLDCSKYQR